ncbi:MAG TPA: GDSL-type esterase/lipase family protein [Phycisphaerae bacterium]|nr:GDSL-type esterase/lipase family protein [Phycisphaerae bacterium]
MERRIAAGCVVALAFALAADGAERGKVQAVIVDKAPPIDGRGAEGAWAKCPPMPLGDCSGTGPGAFETTARVLFDATKLYVAWQCAESDTDSLAQATTRRDGDVWEDDCVELFVTGDPREGYYHFVINPAGVVYDGRRSAASASYDAAWSPPIDVKAHVEKAKGWSVTLAVPLKELGAFVGEGQAWVCNLNRTRPARGGRGLCEWSWAVMGSNDYHQVKDYGRIAGVTVPKRTDGVTREATPPPAPPSYDKGTQAGSVIVYRRMPELVLRDTGEGLAETIDLAIAGSRGLKVVFLASGQAGGDGYGKTDSGAPEMWPVTFNMSDRRSRDNTTSKAYRYLVPGRPQPMVYFCDNFRYNAVPNSTVAAATDYTNLRFHGRAPGGKGVLTLRELVIYRGEDTDPPAAPTGLKAVSEGARVGLSWDPAADNVGVAMYVVSRAGADGRFRKIGECCEPGLLVEPPTADPHRYRVLAVDFQDNLSPWSAEVAIPAAKGNEATRPGPLASDREIYAERLRAIHAAGRGKVRKGVVLAFGDSLTGATSYRSAVEAGLGRYRVVARGYPSMKTSFGRDRVAQELKEVNPEFCLVLYGTNNSKADKAIPPAMEDLKAIADACAAGGTVPVIGTIPPRGFQDPASQPEARYNAALIEMCRKERIPIAYCFEEFQASGDRKALLAGDGVHTHNHGFAAYARAWRMTMDHVLFALLGRPGGEGQTAGKKVSVPELGKKVSVPELAVAESAWPPRGEARRAEITRDNWTATVKDEQFGNNGGSARLKLKGQQEHAIFDIDPAALKGKVITGALWHVRSASPKDPLLRVTVSSLAAPWVEGTSASYRRQEGSSCFVQAELGKRDWAYPGSTLMDVAFGRGHTIWRFAEATPPDENGWQAVAVDAAVVAARVAGLSEGFAAYDDVGSIWSYVGGKFEYTYFPNRFVYSREARGSEPWLEVWTDGTDDQPPGPVTDIAAETAAFPAGQALVTWKTPADAGRAGTLGFQVRYNEFSAGGTQGQVPRYLVPLAGKPGETVRMHLRDIVTRAGERVTLTIAAVDGAGNVGPAVRKSLVVSANPRVLPLANGGLKPFEPSPQRPTVGGLKVAVVDLLDKINPLDGRLIPAQPEGYLGGNHLWSGAEKRIRLQAARNEAVCFQLNLEGKADGVKVELSFPNEAGVKPGVHRLDYVRTSAGPLPDVVLPMSGPFAIPPADDPEAAYARNLSLLCEVYTPHKAPAGVQRGTLTVQAGGESLSLDVELTVWDFTLPNKLSFVPEMNAYGTADPGRNIGYYRLAHEHRLCLNRLYYSWSGSPRLAPEWKDGKLDFTEWDRQCGPLLDGSAFGDLPRAGEPVDVFYLPFNENWPADVYADYRPSYWIEDAFAPAYAETLRKAFAQMAAHCNERGWHDTQFQFYLNNKVYYKTGGWRRSSAPWIFDEPSNTQDFWALRWYGRLWHEATGPVRGAAKMWYRCDVSRSHCDRDMFRGLMDVECLGGSNAQKLRMKADEQVLWGPSYHTEYGSANDPAAANLQPALWCLKAWSGGAIGVLPWQTIGNKDNLANGSQTGLFIPLDDGRIVPSIRLKAFRRGQQDVEYLTLLGEVTKQPPYAVAGMLHRRIDLAGQVHKTSESDAGTLRFDKAGAAALWMLRADAAKVISAASPPYRRCIRPLPSPPIGAGRVPDLGYVRVAPKLPSSKPRVD